MPAAYKIANVIVSASVEPEAFGRVAVEAQSMERPIIASNIGGSKETILNGKSGFLYKYDDPRELAKSLNKVMPFLHDFMSSFYLLYKKFHITTFELKTMQKLFKSMSQKVN